VLTFILRRIVALIPLLFIVSVIVFGLVLLVPGDAATRLAGGEDASPQQIEEVRKELGLDRPFVTQYVDWLEGAVQLDLGDSLFSQRPVASEIWERVPVTLQIAGGALVFGLLIGIPMGIISGMRPRGIGDRGVVMVTSFAIAIPSFWLALILILQLAVYRNILPSRGFVKFSESPTEWFEHLLLPWITLGTLTAATIARQLRGALADTMSSDHIRTSKSVGLPSTKVVGKHALKNSSAPVLTVVGLQVAYLLGGTVVVESIFGIAGLGTYVLTAVQQNDLPAIQGSVLFIAVLTVLVNLLVDISYAILNPKVRVE
jgi:peptide/nickel transport system permease protein